MKLFRQTLNGLPSQNARPTLLRFTRMLCICHSLTFYAPIINALTYVLTYLNYICNDSLTSSMSEHASFLFG